MRIPSEQGIIALVAGIVASACILAVVLLAVREKRRTGHYPPEIVVGSDTGWFSLFWIVWMIGRSEAPSNWLDPLPVSILVLGVDLGLLIAFAAFGAYALAQVFKPDWDRRWGLQVVRCLMFPALGAGLVVSDTFRVTGAAWVWIPGVLIAVFLSPFFARWTYEEFHLRQLNEQEHRQAGRLWRPGSH